MTPNNWFYKLMYRKRVIKYTADSGRNYIIDYHRTPFWTYEEINLKTFFKEKFTSWHGHVWEVFPNGGSVGFAGNFMDALFPRRRMKRFLIAEVARLEKIFNKDDSYESN